MLIGVSGRHCLNITGGLKTKNTVAKFLKENFGKCDTVEKLFVELIHSKACHAVVIFKLVLA